MAAKGSYQRITENYEACSVYQTRVADSRHKRYKDVITFFNEENELYYFATLDKNDQIVLRSEGYPSTGARNNGLKSVLRNREKRTRFKVVEFEGKWFTCLFAGNSQEIGRSCPKPTEAAALALFPPLSPAALALAKKIEEDKAKAAAEAAAAAPKAEEPKPYVPNQKREQDNYLVCSEYEERIADSKYPKHEDIIVFQHRNGLYYFATLDENSKIGLRSEGYPSVKARDNGLKSVLRNREKRTRFKVEEIRGFYFTYLTAGNNQEIGRSCPKRTEDSAMALWAPISAAALALQQSAQTPTVLPKPAAKKVEPEKPKEIYLPCKIYQEHKNEKHPEHEDVAIFDYEDAYYFAVLDVNGEIALRSEGYPSKGARKNGLISVLKNREIKERFDVIEHEERFFTILKAGNNKEIARSCPKNSKETALGLLPGGILTSLGLAAMGLKSDPEPVPKVEATPDPIVPEPVAKVEAEIARPNKIHDTNIYLDCKEYANRPINDKQNQVALFKHSNSLYYFGVFDEDKNLRLRSEGFPTAKQRDEELSGALRFIDEADNYSRIEEDGRYIHILHDDKGREVGRSCPTKEASPFIPLALAVASAPIAMASSSAPTAAASVAATPAAAPAAVPPIRDEGGKKKGCALWMWLLAGLLAILLAWYFLRACNTNTSGQQADINKTSVAKQTVKKELDLAPAPIPVDTIGSEVASSPVEKIAPVVPAAQTCNCNALRHPVFDLPTNRKPNNITKLGSAPEFGNSHGLSPDQFHQKLADRSKASNGDRIFLNGLAKAMGYQAWSDIDSEKYQAVELENGLLGNLGSTPAHKTIYARLNTRGKDLKAFKITAANGCHLHFMKTCGNHFFFCPAPR